MAAGVGIFILWGALSGNKDQAANTTAENSGRSQQAAAPSAPMTPTCQSDWSACADNSDLANNNTKAMAYATVACKEVVNQRAKYGDPKWCSGFLCQDFTKFQRGSDAPKTGLLTIIDDNVQMQNGFGAWAHMRAVCTYNLKTDRVESLSVNEQE